MAAPSACNDPPPELVLDTNVVLDALVFRDPTATALLNALEARRVVAWRNTAIRDELVRTLRKPMLNLAEPDCERILTYFDAWSVEVAAAAPCRTLRCRDPDDQKFVDLAVHTRAGWLLTRDGDLLALGRRARLQGLTIATSAQWATAQGLEA